MVTGDHPFTGKAISRQIGLLKDDKNLELMEGEAPKGDWETSEGAVIHGSHIDGLTEEQWHIILSKPGVCFARTTPAHKLLIVQQCQKMGHIVAVTGDGMSTRHFVVKIWNPVHCGLSHFRFAFITKRCQRCSRSEASGCWNRHGVEWICRRARRSRYITNGYDLSTHWQLNTRVHRERTHQLLIFWLFSPSNSRCPSTFCGRRQLRFDCKWNRGGPHHLR